MTIPLMFRNRNPKTLTSYSYIDIASGTGVVRYYGFASKTAGTEDYHLSTDKFYSPQEYKTATLNFNNSDVKVIDLDFDLTINTSQIINGDVLISIPYKVEHTNINGDGNAYFKAILLNGSTEIGNGQTETYTWTQEESSTSELGLIKINVDNSKLKKGDTLRLTIEGWASATDNQGSTIMTFAFSPYNNDLSSNVGTLNNYQLSIDVPFKINL